MSYSLSVMRDGTENGDEEWGRRILFSWVGERGEGREMNERGGKGGNRIG